MLSGSLVSAVLIYGLGVCPKVEGVTWRRYLTLIVPLAALYAYQLWSSNAAYLYLAVGYIQVAQAADAAHTERAGERVIGHLLFWEGSTG